MLLVQRSSDMGSSVAARPAATRSTRTAFGVTVATLLVLLAGIGASAEHGAGAAQLRRGPASIVLSVLITLAGLAGVASLALLFWGLVTRNRRRLNTSAQRRHSPILIAGALLAIFACIAGLLALAARQRHSQALTALGGTPLPHSGPTPRPLPFNATASFTTSGIIVGVVVLFVVVRMVRSIGWRRALRKLAPRAADGHDEADLTRRTGPDLETFGALLSSLDVADPSSEPDARRAVIACYLQLLEVAARHGPRRRSTETPTEYLLRVFAVSQASVGPATSLTALFERARYSRQPIDERMRSDAIAALRALKESLLLGVPA